MTRGGKGGAPKQLDGATLPVTAILDEPAQRALASIRKANPTLSDSAILRSLVVGKESNEAGKALLALRDLINEKDRVLTRMADEVEALRRSHAELQRLTGAASLVLGEDGRLQAGDRKDAKSLLQDVAVIRRQWARHGPHVEARARAERDGAPMPSSDGTAAILFEAARRAGGWARLLDACMAQEAPA